MGMVLFWIAILLAALSVFGVLIYCALLFFGGLIQSDHEVGNESAQRRTPIFTKAYKKNP
jgi:hypothetical protein